MRNKKRKKNLDINYYPLSGKNEIKTVDIIYSQCHTDFIGEISSGNLKIGKIPILTKESCPIEA